ncbi:DUF1835 domain-containing protein [Brevibacillus parabrevis]|uniref:DUF1835 domain-containing protein n=1 Tax=Brevibacillus parabrevis TaxID=54914 RepID=UPI001F62631D|nr:DUF1835 domain-containing protein [Brevibacillus parabrevis]MDR4998925.1 DUF1835 domain-containing protein [Brevibacillus parabrevis]
MQTFHIGFGDSACGTLRVFLRAARLPGSIICLRDDFSIGPIAHLTTEDGMEQRWQWFKNLLVATEPDFQEDLELFAQQFQQDRTFAADIPAGSTVVLWHGGRCTSDQLGIRYVVSMLQSKSIRFEAVDVSAYSQRIHYTVTDEENNTIPYVIRSVGEIYSERLHGAWETKASLSSAQIEEWVHDWEAHWLHSTSRLRIIENGLVQAVPEDYYDAALLQCSTRSFQKAGRVIGEVMGRSEQCIGDMYLLQRIQELIRAGKLSYRGELAPMRYLEIRLADAALTE